jgi:uncharacterized coiled-coil protein SlyX
MLMSTYVAVFALLLAYVALVVAYFALRTLAKLRRSSALLIRGMRGDAARESLIELTGRYAERTEVVAEQSAALAEHTAELSQHVELLRAAVERAAVERAAVERAAIEEAASAAAPADVATAVSDPNGALRNTALVRYDAFADLSGRMSFSLALLDEDGNGVTLSAIAGRSDTRVYAKGVTAGKGEHELSPEEQQAVTAALNTKRRLRKTA